MRCQCCDRGLSDYEATLKHRDTGEYLDTCVKCLKGLSIPSVGREDLLGKQEPVEDDDASEADASSMHYDEAFNDDLGPMMYDDDN